jgi:hypothetical protein
MGKGKDRGSGRGSFNLTGAPNFRVLILIKVLLLSSSHPSSLFIDRV